jgi:hypothetical protein
LVEQPRPFRLDTRRCARSPPFAAALLTRDVHDRGEVQLHGWGDLRAIPGQVDGGSRSYRKRVSIQKKSGNGVYYTVALLLLMKICCVVNFIPRKF